MHEMSEIDTQQQVYISWVKFGGQYYRIFTGVLAEGEVYLQDLIWKYEAVEEALPPELKHIQNFLEWSLVRIDTFIDDANLVQYQSNNGVDYSNKTIHLDNRTDALTSRLGSAFVLEKDSLSADILIGLKNISYRPEEYSDGGMHDFYSKPVVEYDKCFVIPFPQLLVPAILKWVFEEITQLANKNEVCNLFTKKLKDRVKTTLKIFFGENSVLEELKLNGEDWADFCVRYDGKLIFISVLATLSGEDLSDMATEKIKSMFEFKTSYINDKSQTIGSLKGSPVKFEDDIELLEPIVITLVDVLDEDLMFGIGDVGENTLHDVMPFSNFDFIIHSLTSPLHFIRYLRAIDDMRKRKISMPGATPADLFAMYKEGNHQLREAEQDPNMLMVDLTAGARIITEDTRLKRESASLISLDGKKYYMRKHWDNFYGQISREYMLLYRTDTIPTINFKVPLSRGEASEELRHSVYIVFDSLCYFLDQKFALVKDVLPADLESISITVETITKSEGLIKMSSSIHDSEMHLTIQVGEKAHEIFTGNDNSGERKIIQLFAEATKIPDAQAWLDTVIPLSPERNFQTNTYSLSHQSYENAPQPMTLEDGDRWWVDEILSKAILDAGIQPGMYEDPEKIGELATTLASISKQKLIDKLKKYPRQEIIERSYAELEAVYAQDERKEYETLASIAINGHEDIIKKHTEHNQDFTQLSFAYRYLIEASLQTSEEGHELLTDEAFLEILALAERYVDVEFWGDTTFYGLQPGKLYISKRGFPGIASNGNGGILSRKRAFAALKSAKYRSDLREKARKEGALKPGEKEKAMYDRLNAPFKTEFGYTLEDFIDTAKAMIDLFSDLKSPILMTSKTVLRDKLSSETGIDADTTASIIERLTLSMDGLKDVDINPSQRFWREERLLNKPLVSMPRNENILLFTRAVLERMAMSFLDRLMSGRLDYLKNHQKSELNKTVMDIVNEDATKFEDTVCDSLEEKGLQVRRRVKSLGGETIPREGVGEIDGLAWDAKKRTVYVIEIKDNEPSRSPIEIKSEIDNYYGRDKKKGYYKQLGDKYDWIKANQELIRKEFQIEEKVKIKVKPALVTNAIVASSILKSPPHPTYTLDEFIEET